MNVTSVFLFTERSCGDDAMQMLYERFYFRERGGVMVRYPSVWCPTVGVTARCPIRPKLTSKLPGQTT